MSEIKVGDYIRTDNGVIGKYIIQQSINYIDTGKNYIGFDIENDIAKHSPNIIDLIEEGDMLNKNEVIEVKGMGLCIYDINNKNWLPIENIDYPMGVELRILTHQIIEGEEYVC